MGDKHLSEVIDYHRDIEPNLFLEIYAGVGSGKTYYFEQLAAGKIENAPKFKVLIITSRRAKVDETLEYYEDDGVFDKSIGFGGNVLLHPWREEERHEKAEFHRVITDDEGIEHHVYQKNVVCTNAFIEGYFRNVYDPAKWYTHVWQLYDMIVIDEAHSLIRDASYQSAPFHVYELINEYLRQHDRAEKEPEKYNAPLCRHMVLLTGTPNSIRRFVLDGNRKPVLDKMDECINTVPKNIFFIRNKDVIGQIERQLKSGERIVYFKNSTTTVDEFCKGTGIDPAIVATSFTKEEKKKDLEKNDPDGFKKMCRVEESIKKDYSIPSDIRLFVTTSRYKEGVNIKDKDIRYMYVEVHNQSDMIQMAGRLRAHSGVENLYVIMDVPPFKLEGYDNPFERELDREFSKLKMGSRSVLPGDTSEGVIISPADRHLSEIKDGQEDSWFDDRLEMSKYKLPDYMKPEEEPSYRRRFLGLRFIEYIEKHHRYIRYSYIYQSFIYDELREKSETETDKDERLWAKVRKNRKLKELLQLWFPTANVHDVPVIKKEKSATEKKKDEEARAYWKQAGIVLGKEYTYDEIMAIKDALQKIYPGMSQLNSMLKRFCNIICKESGKHCGKGKQKYVFRERTD